MQWLVDQSLIFEIQKSYHLSDSSYQLTVPDTWIVCVQAPYLKSLNLAFCSMLLDSGVQALAALTSLTDLNLAYCKWITADGVSALSTLTALTSLSLQGCSQTAPPLNQGLTALQCMPGLATLNLGSCKLKPLQLSPLAGLTQLTELSLRFCKGLLPADLAAVSSLHRLGNLDINGCLACTDASLSYLRPLRYLQKLNIGFNRQLTDAALARLTGLTHLQHLSVNNCPLMTEAALDLLLAVLPSLTKLTTTESHDAEQILLLHNKRVPSCFASFSVPDAEQGHIVEDV